MIKRILLTLGLSAATASAFASSTDVSSMLANQGFLLTLGIVFAFGVGVSFTPCVYPMIPITLSIIGARSAQQKPVIGFLRSLVFVLGIAVVYSALGLLAARMNWAFGFLFQNKWFVALIALFFVGMGLSMMGWFTIQMPASIAGRLQPGASRGGFVGAFILGLVTGVVASPCGSPVLASTLVLAAQSGKAFVGVSLLFVYSLGIGVLFLVLGTFPSFLKAIPKSGAWMDDVKKFMGAVLIAVGAWYLRLVIPASVYWPLVVIACLASAVGLAVLAGHRRANPRLFTAWRIAAIGVAAFAVYAAIEKAPAVIAGKQSMGSAEWLSSEAAAVQQARVENRPMIVDFGAEWCAACNELEEKTFSDPAVKQEMMQFVKVRIDCTADTEKTQALQKKYGSVSLPTVAFVDKSGKQLTDLSLLEFEKPAKFIERLKKVPR
jgi:thiol:disulfide interchange protein DsbD